MFFILFFIAMVCAQRNDTLGKTVLNYCWKRTYTRGLGFPPNHCSSNEEKGGLLCHEKCKPGYQGIGFLCWKECPVGYKNRGTFCVRQRPMHVILKKNYNRKVGKPMKCPPNHELNAGLCHPNCKSGYQGIGPVCWQQCKTNRTCAAGCSDSKFGCAFNAIEMTYASSWLTMNIVTLGRSAAITGKQGQAQQLVNNGATQLNPQVLMQHKSDISNLLLTDSTKLSRGIAESIAGTLVEHAHSRSTIDWTVLDPTGVAAVVKAFMKPRCND